MKSCSDRRRLVSPRPAYFENGSKVDMSPGSGTSGAAITAAMTRYLTAFAVVALVGVALQQPGVEGAAGFRRFTPNAQKTDYSSPMKEALLSHMLEMMQEEISNADSGVAAAGAADYEVGPAIAVASRSYFRDAGGQADAPMFRKYQMKRYLQSGHHRLPAPAPAPAAVYAVEF